MAKKKVRNLEGIVCLSLAAFLIYMMGTQGMRIYRQKQELNQLQTTVVDLKKHKDKLSDEVKNLKDDDYVIRYARENYIFSKDGEDVVKLPESKK